MAFPKTGLLDTFTRANEGPPPSANWSGPVQSGSGQLQVVSNQLTSGGSALNRNNYWNVSTFGPNCEAYVTLTTLGTDPTYVDLYIRAVNPGGSSLDGYLVELSREGITDHCECYRMDNAVFTQLGAQASQEWASGDSLGIAAIGSTLLLYRKPAAGTWALLTSRADATYPAPGYIGVNMGDAANAAVDDFGGGTLTGPLIIHPTGGGFLDSVSGTKSATVVPAIDDLVVLITVHTGNTSAAAPTDNNSGGAGTYTLAESRVKAASADTIAIWIRNSLIGAATSTVFTHAPGTSTGGGIFVFLVSNMTKVGAAAKAKSGGQSNQSAATPAITWTGGGSASASNPLIAAVFNATNPAGLTKPASFDFEAGDTGYATPTTGLELVIHDAGGNTDATVTWGNASPSAFASVALELDASTGAVVSGVPIFADEGIHRTIFGGAVLR